MPRSPKQFEEIREKTKKKILDYSLRLFAEKGYHATSISDIAKAAGISKGLAYNYFESKQHLAESIFEQVLELGSHFEEFFTKIDDPHDQLKKTIDFTFNFMEENEEFWRLYVSFSLQPVIMDTAKRITKNFNDRMIGHATKIFKRIGMPNPKAEAYIFGGILDGISLNYFFDKENYPLDSVRKKIIEKYSKEVLAKLKK